LTCCQPAKSPVFTASSLPQFRNLPSYFWAASPTLVIPPVNRQNLLNNIQIHFLRHKKHTARLI
jgi:hypothetical protein